MARLEGAGHQESSLPGSVQPLLASVSLPSFDLLYKQGISPAPAKGVAHSLTTTTTLCHESYSRPRSRRRRGHWERLLWPGHASLPSPGPAPAPGLMMDKPAPPGVPSQGALEKQPRPGVRPAGMDGSELGAHARDHPPVCEHAHAHGWMFLHTCAFFPAAHALVHASGSTHGHTYTHTHVFTCTGTHTRGPAAWHGSNTHFHLPRERHCGDNP